MRIILANEMELTPIMVMGEHRFLNGIERDVLTFVFPAVDSTLNTYDELFTEAACETITIIGDDESEAIYEGYAIRVELKKELVKVSNETATEAAVMENRIFVSMAQKTYSEAQLGNIQEVIDAILMEEVEI